MMDVGSKIRRMLDFLSGDLWRIRLRDLSPHRSFLIRHLRVAILTVRGVIQDKCLLRASALTFYALMSIGPVAALIFGIAKGFGLQKRLEEEVLSQIPVQEEVLHQILRYAHILLENTRGGVVAGVGVVILLWSALKVFNHLEASLNDIWQVEQTRSWKRKISNYLSFLLVAPLILLVYSSAPAFMATQLESMASKFEALSRVSPVLLLLLSMLPYVVVWGLFTFIYITIPHTRVEAVSGIVAGLLAGTVYLLSQWAMIEFQVGVTRYNPIYGSLVALPLLLLWMHVGWVILLVGAEYAYAHQHVQAFEFETDFANISPHLKKVLSLHIVHLLVQRFSEGRPPLTADQVARRLDIPIRLVHQILNELKKSGLINAVCGPEDEEPAVQPSSDIHEWTLTYVMDRLEQRGVNQLPVMQGATLSAIENALQKLNEARQASPANRLLQDLPDNGKGTDAA
jgi:membrane protein